jgi:hypothetical protein
MITVSLNDGSHLVAEKLTTQDAQIKAVRRLT